MPGKASGGARMTAHSDRWSGRAGFILATVGSAVGIGSIWKFPCDVGAHGGSAFVLFYLAGLVLVVVPLMLATPARCSTAVGSFWPRSLCALNQSG